MRPHAKLANAMGIGIVLIFWGVVGLIGATIGSVILPGLASHFTQGRVQRSRRLIWVVRLFPYACLGWAGAVFVFYAIVNESVFHRDPGIGDGWTCPLPNGYAIGMIDVTDRGFVYNPKTQTIDGVVAESNDALADVCVLQLVGPYILGGAPCRTDVPHGPKDHDAVLSYFLLDTATGTHATFPTYEALRVAAAPMNIQVNLEPIDVVYGRYRFTWFDAAAAAAMFGVPLLCASLLIRRMLAIRRSAAMLPGPA
jgi:hypothetical protein